MGDRGVPAWWDGNKVRREAELVQRLLNLSDVSYECSHGALPLDRTKPADCKCWTPDVTEALARRTQESPDFEDAA